MINMGHHLKGTLQDLFQSRKRRLDESSAEAISTFLASISEEYDRNANFNYKYVLESS